MAFIPAPNCARVELVYTGGSGQIYVNVLNYLFSATPPSATMVDLGEKVGAIWDTDISDYVSSDISLTGIRITDIGSAIGQAVELFPNPAYLGKAGGAVLPGNVTVAMTLRTLFRGRSYRGRIFHVGLEEAMVTRDVLQGATLTGLKAAYTLLIDPPSVGDPKLVVLSKYAGGAPRSQAQATEVQSVTSDGFVDSQRRRLTKRGS